MPGPMPKAAGTRQRRNKTTTARKLAAVPTATSSAPPMPKAPMRRHGDGTISEETWHANTVAWWERIWASPMAPEFHLAADYGELLKLLVLEDDFWWAEGAGSRRELLAEIRLQRQCFGLTPLDRRRLQWEISRGEDAEARTAATRNARAPRAAKAASRPDPRQRLAE